MHADATLTARRLLAFILGLGLGVRALDNGVARTPPMGWNSWVHFHESVNAQILFETADHLVETGLRDAGYTYVNVDDFWMQATRGEDGRLQPSPNFPGGAAGMMNLSRYMHERGLKFGVYGAASLVTCTNRMGNLFNEYLDAQTYADWGVDYLKYDDCAQYNIQGYAKFQVMRDALNATGRRIVYSYEPFVAASRWPAYVGNLWRTGHDISPYYGVILSLAKQANAWLHVAGPGAWTDPGTLEVGNVAGNVGLTVAEARTQFALWCLLKAPLLIGADIRKIQPAYLEILSNRELIAISQDPLAHMGRLVASAEPGATARPLQAPRRADKVKNPRTFSGITECELEDEEIAQVKQQWTLSNSTIQQNDWCVTLGSDNKVTFSSCDGSQQQLWSFDEAKRSTALISSQSSSELCLATDGQQLLVETCQEREPEECYKRRCTNSPRSQQLWYWSPRTGQLLSSFSKDYPPPLKSNAGELDYPSNAPKCLALVQNPMPPEPPPAPPTVDSSKPLLVWAGKLSQDRIAVVLLNSQPNGTAMIKARWEELWLSPGQQVRVRDVVAQKDMGTARDEVSALVGGHDVAVLTLTPEESQMEMMV